MKYSISILFLLTILVAIEAALFRRQVDWSVLVTVATGLLLMFVKWRDLQSEFARPKGSRDQVAYDASSSSIAPANKISNTLIVSVITLCFGGAVFSLLTAATDPDTGKLLNDHPRNVSAYSVLILATLLLSSSVVHMPAHPIKPLRRVFSVVVVLAMVLGLVFLIDPPLWYVYIACRGVENAMLDPNHILLGASRVLLFRVAAYKASVGVLGWCLWLSVAVLAYRYVQRRTSGVFVTVWVACGLGCLATFFQWRFMLDDFPELGLSIRELLRDKHNYNLVLFLILGATGFLQYCLTDRNNDKDLAVGHRLKSASAQVWQSRLLGLAMMLPVLVILGAKVLKLNQLSYDWFGWFALILLASDLLSNESLMLLGLLILGTRKIAEAHNSSPKFIPLPTGSFFQLLLVGCILVVFLPLHFAVSQFYFDAVFTLSPI